MRNEILKMLENNSRIDLHDLAIMLGTDESMVLEEIEKMENEGIICGYPTLINWDKTDTEKVTAFIEVRVTPQRGQGFEKLAERITNYPEVKSIYLMSGAFDFAIFLEGKTLKEEAKEVVKKVEKAVEEKVDYAKLTVAELKDLCKEKALEITSTMKKADLIKLLEK